MDQLKTCPKCKRTIYTRDDGTQMVRRYWVYDGVYDWRDNLHRCNPPTPRPAECGPEVAKEMSDV